MTGFAVDFLRVAALGGQRDGTGLLTVEEPPHHEAKNGGVLRRRQFAVLVLVGKTLYQKCVAACLGHGVVKD